MTPAPAVAPGGNTRAILAALSGVAAFTIGDILVKLTATQLPLGQMIAIRGLFALGLILLICGFAGALRHPKVLLDRFVVMRMVGEVGAALFFFSALLRMPFADTNAVLQFVPLGLTAASAIFLAEPVGWRRWTATLVGLAGVLMIVRPGAPQAGIGPVFALLSVASIIVRDIATRRVPAEIPTLLLSAATIGAVMLSGVGLGLFETWARPSGRAWAMLAGAACAVVFGGTLFIVAMRTGEVSAVAPFRYSVVVFAIIAGYLVWDERPDEWTLLGTAIVVGAGLYTFRREQRLRASRGASTAAGSR